MYEPDVKYGSSSGSKPRPCHSDSKFGIKLEPTPNLNDLAVSLYTHPQLLLSPESLQICDAVTVDPISP